MAGSGKGRRFRPEGQVNHGKGSMISEMIYAKSRDNQRAATHNPEARNAWMPMLGALTVTMVISPVISLPCSFVLQHFNSHSCKSVHQCFQTLSFPHRAVSGLCWPQGSHPLNG
jgi:hypothetical protein